jgi:hypothetical protein
MIDPASHRTFGGSARVFFVAAVVLSGLLASCSSPKSGAAGTGSTGNLIVNGNAEAALGSIDGTPVSTPNWVSAGEATAAQYTMNGWPLPTDSGPADRGLNLFSGGPTDSASSLTQTVNVSHYAGSIDKNHATYKLSGWLGGYADQGDNATVTVTFQDALGNALGTGSIGPVTASDRSNQTGLLARSSDGAVPSGTRKVLVVVSMVRTDGTANDGYADNLSLVLSGIDVALLGAVVLDKTGAEPPLNLQAPTAP